MVASLEGLSPAAIWVGRGVVGELSVILPEVEKVEELEQKI